MEISGVQKKKGQVLMPKINPLLGANIDVNEGPGPVLKKKLFKIDGAIAYTSGGALILRPKKTV
jgi:hypothetical protein